MSSPPPSDIPVILHMGDSLARCYATGARTFRDGSVYKESIKAYENTGISVVNGGTNGYNSTMEKDEMQETIEQCKRKGYKPVAASFWLGANDGILPGQSQAVSVDEFAKNLASIEQSAHEAWPGIPLMFITAPPTVPEQSREFMRDHWIKRGSQGTEPGVLRDVNHSKSYVDATKKFVAGMPDSHNVHLVDAYSAVENEAQQSGTPLSEFFFDGVHLKASGNKLVFDEFMRVIQSEVSSLDPDRMPRSEHPGPKGPLTIDLRPWTEHAKRGTNDGSSAPTAAGSRD